ncbi:MAG TPA: hypothetical protein VJ373_02850 [Desulfatiglandales bacterium]|nr:hypothetical protein [Desulfatiglandales bacterium]
MLTSLTPFDKPFDKLTALSEIEGPFDKPFDGLMVLSKVERLTALSKIEGLMAAIR